MRKVILVLLPLAISVVGCSVLAQARAAAAHQDMPVWAHLVILGIWLFALWYTIKPLAQKLRWRHRPTIAGKIVFSRVQSSVRRLPPPASIRFTHYTPMVAYEYEVGGVKYSSHRIFSIDDGETELVREGIDHPAEKDAQKVVDRYPLNSTVQVYYEPHDPSRAVLEIADPAYISHAVNVALVGFGIGALLYILGTFQWLLAFF